MMIRADPAGKGKMKARRARQVRPRKHFRCAFETPLNELIPKGWTI